MAERQHLHRLPRVWIKPPVYFVTACTAGCHKLLHESEAAEILRSAWRAAPAIHGWMVGRYVIMPDHVPFFASPKPAAKSLSAFVRDWKKWTSRKLIEHELALAPVWQPEFFDHVLRSPKSYSEKWNYVRENPVRAGLVAESDQWPFQGECVPLRL